MAPSGLFCMSGHVAHADDDDDDDDICGYSHMPKTVPSHSSPLWGRPCSAVREEMDLLSSEKKSANADSDVEFLTQQYSRCSVEYHCSEGTGKIYWPSGSFYIGEVTGGNLHGIGTYTGADGTVYLGNWILNKKHGFGRKKYANGDVYEGLWKWDVPEGQGHYFWSNGSEYVGDWRNGMMCGIGVLTWVSGDSYDGQWLNGLADGHGVYTWADGSIYIGTWRKGLKCGAGRLYSPGRKSKEILSSPDACIDSEKHAVAGEDWINGHEPANMLQGVRSGEGASSDKLTTDTATSTQEDDQLHSLVLERLWRLDSSGNCLLTLPAETYLKERRSSFHNENNLGMVHETESDYGLWFMKQQKSPGEMVSKDHRSYDLVLALQLGIRHSVVEATASQNRKVIPTDFGPKARVRAKLPRDSSELTPRHYSAEFKWTDYCPTVFRHLRELSKVDPENYMLSICGSGGFREIPSPGKSGCFFYLTPDERFMIKTLRKAEVKVFLRMLPRYYNHVRMYKNTLLTKFFGLHSIKLAAGGQKVQFVVMGNVVSSNSRIHRVYDLKGSSEGRTTNKAETTEGITLKDLDLNVVFHLDPCSRDTILEQIHKDCKFLESEHIMDYSLLLGLHFKDPQQNSCLCQGHGPMVNLPLHEVVISSFIAQNGSVESSISEAQDFEQANAVPRKSFVKSGLEEEAETEKLSFKNERQHIKIGAKMHAKACQSPWQGNCDSFCSESHDVVLYFGIIDILQEYNLSKKLEHAYKSIQFDPLSVSAVDPTLYSKRFQHFMHQIFLLNT